MKTKSKDLIKDDKVFGLIAACTAAILCIPLIAMQISSEWDWGIFDFLIMGTLLFGAGSVFVLLARKVKKNQRLIVGLIILAAVLLTWVHLAVGIVDTWPFAGS